MAEGDALGVFVGPIEGDTVGFSEGDEVGVLVVGVFDGDAEGLAEGGFVGPIDGDDVEGLAEGNVEGAFVGALDGDAVKGCVVGTGGFSMTISLVGLNVGLPSDSQSLHSPKPTQTPPSSAPVPGVISLHVVSCTSPHS